MDEPFMRNIPATLPDDADDETRECWKKFNIELVNMQASRQAMLDDFGMVIPLQDIGNQYRVPLLIDFVLGVHTQARLQFERMWIAFLQEQLDQQRVICNQQQQVEARRAKAKHLHIPGQGVHEVLPQEGTDNAE